MTHRTLPGKEGIIWHRERSQLLQGNLLKQDLIHSVNNSIVKLNNIKKLSSSTNVIDKLNVRANPTK